MPPKDPRSAGNETGQRDVGASNPAAAAASLEEILITRELDTRVPRVPDYRAENEALSSLALSIANEPEEILQRLVEIALALCGAQSAGVSIWEPREDPSVFRWRATTGAFAALQGRALPRTFSPCGVVVDRDALQLMRSPVRYYPYIAQLSEPVHEVLLAPFHYQGTPVGTVWVVAHSPEKHFDSEDARLVTSLSKFAEAAWQTASVQAELASARRRLSSALIAAELGVYEWEIGSDRLFGDANFQKLFEVRLDATGSAPLQDYIKTIHPDDRAEALRRVQRSVQTGENFEMDYRVQLRDRERWINSRGQMTRDGAGKVVSFCGVVVDITERKRAELEREAIADKLRRLSAINETVLSATNDFAYVFDRQGRFLYANRELLKVWAKTLDQVVGKTCRELGYPEWHADMHMREIAQVIATKQPIRGEVPFTGDSGISGIYDYIFTPVFGENGEVELVAGTTRDVTERRFSEDRDRFLVALDDATRPLTDPEEIVRTSAQLLGDHLDVNRCAYADVEADENTFNLTGDYNREVPSIVGRYRFDEFGAECLRQMRANEAYVVEDARTDARLGSERDTYEATKIRSVVCVPLHKAGRFVAAMAVHRVDSRKWSTGEIELVRLVANRCWESIERARVMRVLADSEQQLRLAVETGRLGVWQLDLNTETLTCSAQCKANYGRAPDGDFSYAEFWQVLHPEDRERVRAAVLRAVAEGADLDLEYQTVWPDGSSHWVLVRGQAGHAVDGTRRRLVGVSLDITARKQAEREIARLHDEAVRGLRAKDDFLAALSHELRTPLNPVLLIASESALDLELPAHAREAFDIIRRNVELEARLIDDLLDLTGIARGKLVIKKEIVGLHEVLTEAAMTLRADYVGKDVSLEMHLSAKRHAVNADRVRLLQIFLNLLRNAVKFTPMGGHVLVSSRLVEPDTLEITVTDTGLGMTPDELTRVFGAFQQGDHAASTGAHRFGGLGLGLAIARQLVQVHEGTIRAVSEGRNMGTSIIVCLPLDTSLASEDRRGVSVPAPMPGIRPYNGSVRARVLLIEDHEPTRTALRQLLHRRTYQVTSVGSVAEARAAVKPGTFDFVISDIGLPDGDGALLMAELRDNFGLKGIALTGYGMEQDIARCQAAGFVAHLTKPVRIDSLEAALGAMRPGQV